MTVIQQGNINSTALSVPDLYIQIVPPQNAFINGIPTNILGMVGIASWGPTNSPTVIGSVSQQIQQFGPISTATFDLGTHVALASLQNANNFRCVRVTDGTDTAATANVIDTVTSTNITGIVLTGFYTGTVGNTIVATVSTGTSSTSSTPTFKLTLVLPNGVPEVFDNIGGTGQTLWTNMVNAVNLGQNGLRGPSQLCVASLANGLGGFTVTTPGSYTTIPTLSFTGGGGGSGATATCLMKGLVPTAIAAAGSGYMIGDTITLAGGTNTLPTILTVATVSGSGVASVTVSQAGSYSAIPSNPVAQASTSGSGSGATFTMAWGILGATITASGSGYTSAPTVVVSSGSGALTALVGSQNAPKITNYTLAGGTNGNSGVTATTLIGSDTAPRKGMYALRNTGCSVVDLCDHSSSTDWSTIAQYGLSEGSYMIETAPAGQSVSTTLTNLQTAGVDSYAISVIVGDWVYWNDPYNTVLRLVSPQPFKAGVLVAQGPQYSALNDTLYGLTGTQTSYANQTYSNAQLQAIAAARLDVITNPSPGGSYFSFRFGRNTSSNVVINGDNYTRMTNYIAYSLNSVMGTFVGQLQSPTEQLAAQTTLQTFLSNLQQQGMIGSVNGGPAFQVVLGPSNNPANRVALGYQQADVKVIYLSVIAYFIINIQGGQSVTIQQLAVQPLAA
jgi:hypothetical protein